MSSGVRQFLLTDPAGNIIGIGQPLMAAESATAGAPLPPRARLGLPMA
jgi:hypothetical protein